MTILVGEGLDQLVWLFIGKELLIDPYAPGLGIELPSNVVGQLRGNVKIIRFESVLLSDVGVGFTSKFSPLIPISVLPTFERDYIRKAPTDLGVKVRHLVSVRPHARGDVSA
jgi:hypothetical protein